MDSIVYRPFCNEDIPALVRMWRESREAWPPGFFGASEITAESVSQEEKASANLFSVAALAGDRIVGYCRTSGYGGEPDAAYIGVINVVPGLQGSGIGKALLLDAVSRSAEAGKQRVDLHTWPANLKAVPLYKKTGFFWVPDTRVYMQNYMPALLRDPDFREFIGEDHWYRCFIRDIETAPDTETSPSGRQVFRYLFRRGGNTFQAEFDRLGRCLSGIRRPGFTAELSLNPGVDHTTGEPILVTLRGTGIDTCSARAEAAGSLAVTEKGGGEFSVKPLPVRLPGTKSDPADRITITSGSTRLSVGILAEEGVSLHRSDFRFLPPGTGSVTLGVRKRTEADSVEVTYSVDSCGETHAVVPLDDRCYQNLTLELPPLSPGVHRLSLRLGRNGFRETVALIAGIHTGDPVFVDGRRKALLIRGDRVLAVNRRGGYSQVFTRDAFGDPLETGHFFISAGPPTWNTDLTLQKYEVQTTGDTIRCSTQWPSRPGLVFSFESWLDPAGFAGSRARVENGTQEVQRVSFRARTSLLGDLRPHSRLIPVAGGLLDILEVYNQVPDRDEDFSAGVPALDAPWMGTRAGNRAAMTTFDGWTMFEMGIAGTEESPVNPGETIESPPFCMMDVPGGAEALLSKADALGWRTGNWRNPVEFPSHDLSPVMGSGADVTLTHPLEGRRMASIAVPGVEVCSGSIRSGEAISGKLSGEGAVDVSLTVAGRERVVPVWLTTGASQVKVAREAGGILSISGERITVKLDPAARGQVFSAVLDGTEFILASRPEPSEFVWEKPWFGGIHPDFTDPRNRSFPLEEHPPEVEPYQRSYGGVEERGWRMVWKVNHLDYGSAKLQWTAVLLPGVPVLRTELCCLSPEGGYTKGEANIRGFLQPGGSRENTRLSCACFPGLKQGRDHAGAWVPLGRWGRVQEGSSFIEAHASGSGALLAEDYGEMGCHFSLYEPHLTKQRFTINWVFGSKGDDSAIAEVFRAHG